MSKGTTEKLLMVFTFMACVVALLVVLVFLTPMMTEVLSLARKYQVRPDTWVYYAILSCCAAAFFGSLFIIFHHRLVRNRNGRGGEKFTGH